MTERTTEGASHPPAGDPKHSTPSGESLAIGHLRKRSSCPDQGDVAVDVLGVPLQPTAARERNRRSPRKRRGHCIEVMYGSSDGGLDGM